MPASLGTSHCPLSECLLFWNLVISWCSMPEITKGSRPRFHFGLWDACDTLTTKCENPSSTFCTAPLVGQKNPGATGLECALRQVMFQLTAWRAPTGFVQGLMFRALLSVGAAWKTSAKAQFKERTWKKCLLVCHHENKGTYTGRHFFFRKKSLRPQERETWGSAKHVVMHQCFPQEHVNHCESACFTMATVTTTLDTSSSCSLREMR